MNGKGYSRCKPSKKNLEARAMEEVVRPWGEWRLHYEGGCLGTNYKLKILQIAPGEFTSLQKHYHRSEFWIVVDGEGEALVDDRCEQLVPGSTIKVGRNENHRLTNTGSITLTVLELQFGPVCEESDIVRYE